MQNNCHSFYYENGVSKIEFNPKLDCSNFIVWIKGSDIIYPMQTTKPNGYSFDYIDIDAIDNKNQKISQPKTLLVKDAPSRASRKVFPNSTIFSLVRPYLRNIALVGKKYENCIASTGFYVLTPLPFIDEQYLFLLLTSDYIVNSLNYYMKGDNSPSITTTVIENFYFPIPPISYQKRIVRLFDLINPLIEQIKNSSGQIRTYCKAIKNKVLDLYFGENSSYKSYYEKKYTLGELLEYEQPGPYIVKSTEYNDLYKTPVLTPGKSFILGYTNENDGIYKVEGKKVIIFDDFTTASRIIDFDFKVKSSAMKILSNIDETKFDIEYLYYLLQTIHINNDTHKRYWISEFAPLKVKIHTLDEQQKIVKTIKILYNKLESINNV